MYLATCTSCAKRDPHYMLVVNVQEFTSLVTSHSVLLPIKSNHTSHEQLTGVQSIDSRSYRVRNRRKASPCLTPRQKFNLFIAPYGKLISTQITQSKEGFYRICRIKFILKAHLHCDWCIDLGVKGHHIPHWCHNASYWAIKLSSLRLKACRRP